MIKKYKAAMPHPQPTSNPHSQLPFRNTSSGNNVVAKMQVYIFLVIIWFSKHKNIYIYKFVYCVCVCVCARIFFVWRNRIAPTQDNPIFKMLKWVFVCVCVCIFRISVSRDQTNDLKKVPPKFSHSALLIFCVYNTKRCIFLKMFKFIAQAAAAAAAVFFNWRMGMPAINSKKNLNI